MRFPRKGGLRADAEVAPEGHGAHRTYRRRLFLRAANHHVACSTHVPAPFLSPQGEQAFFVQPPPASVAILPCCSQASFLLFRVSPSASCWRAADANAELQITSSEVKVKVYRTPARCPTDGVSSLQALPMITVARELQPSALSKRQRPHARKPPPKPNTCRKKATQPQSVQLYLKKRKNKNFVVVKHEVNFENLSTPTCTCLPTSTCSYLLLSLLSPLKFIFPRSAQLGHTHTHISSSRVDETAVKRVRNCVRH